jgi:glycerophosphoryl diester phosphodiesterase
LLTRLVAHRGDQDGGVENTLAAFSRATAHGAKFAECDIQFTRDLVPIVLHDNRLGRLCQQPHVCSLDTDFRELAAICAPHFDLATLQDLINWLKKQPDLTLFIEIKPPILKRISSSAIIKLLAPMLPEHLMPRIVLISSNPEILDACSKALPCRRGWVATRHRPPGSYISYVFIPYTDIAAIPDWRAKGIKVGVYTINDAELAHTVLAKGADLIETNHFAKLADELG